MAAATALVDLEPVDLGLRMDSRQMATVCAALDDYKRLIEEANDRDRVRRVCFPIGPYDAMDWRDLIGHFSIDRKGMRYPHSTKEAAADHQRALDALDAVAPLRNLQGRLETHEQKLHNPTYWRRLRESQLDQLVPRYRDPLVVLAERFWRKVVDIFTGRVGAYS